MSVRKRKWMTRKGEAKEAWIVDYVDQDGQRHIETFKRKKEADAYAQQVGVDVRAGTHTPVSKSITVAKAAEDWISTSSWKGARRATLAHYRQHAEHITDRIGNFKLASLTTPRVNAFRDDLLATMSRAMARKVLVEPQVDAARRAAPWQRRPERRPRRSSRSTPTSAARAGSRSASIFRPRMRSRRSSPAARALAAAAADGDLHRPARVRAARTALARTSISRAASCMCASAPTATT